MKNKKEEMNKCSKSFISVLLSVLMITSVTILPIYANAETMKYDSWTYVNPLTPDIKIDTTQNKPNLRFASEMNLMSTTPAKYPTPFAAERYITQQLIARNPVIEVTFTLADINVFGTAIEQGQAAYLNAMKADTEAGNEDSDYLRWTVGGCNVGCKYNNTTAIMTYTVAYNDTADEEKAVTSFVNDAYNYLDLTYATDYEKLWKIYNYVCQTITYTPTEEYNTRTAKNDYLMHSAYGAIKGDAVCQGYALLLYRMLNDNGINAKIISSAEHAWNIAKIGDYYYCIDSTWDDNYNKYSFPYFMKTWNEFEKVKYHTAEDEYKTNDFQSTYPISKTDYNYLKNIATFVETNKISDQKYTGKEVKPILSMNSGVNSTNYKYSYSNNVNCGTGYVKIEGLNGYNNGVTKSFKIAHNCKATTTKATTSKNGSIVTKCSVCDKVISSKIIYYPKTISLSGTSYAYNGKVKTPSVTVKDSKGTVLKKNTDYTVTYASGRKNVGKYSVKITFKGNYSGTKTLYFTIIPPATAISSLSAGPKRFTAKWSKKSAQVTGYQIQYATNSAFKSSKTSTATSYKTTSRTISKLYGKKRYYVRIRTYKKVGSTNYYSSWSKIRYITTK